MDTLATMRCVTSSRDGLRLAGLPLPQAGRQEHRQLPRIVVDTGIHAKRWSREEATRWMVENAGEQQTSAQREIDRYCVYPGQACAFMVGRIAFLKAREAARARLGARFDVRDFHERVLAAGPAPMQVVARMTQDWQGG